MGGGEGVLHPLPLVFNYSKEALPPPEEEGGSGQPPVQAQHPKTTQTVGLGPSVAGQVGQNAPRTLMHRRRTCPVRQNGEHIASSSIAMTCKKQPETCRPLHSKLIDDRVVFLCKLTSLLDLQQLVP